jgi:hypothetical protein
MLLDLFPSLLLLIYSSLLLLSLFFLKFLNSCLLSYPFLILLFLQFLNLPSFALLRIIIYCLNDNFLLFLIAKELLAIHCRFCFFSSCSQLTLITFIIALNRNLSLHNNLFLILNLCFNLYSLLWFCIRNWGFLTLR